MSLRTLPARARRVAARAVLAAALAAASASAKTPYPFSYQTVEVARGVTAFIEPFGSAIVSGNSLLVVGDDAALVVDTGQHPRLTRRMIAEIRRLTRKPVRWVVNTHWHNDHVAGNALYAQAFPEAHFVAQAFTARMLESDVKPYLAGGCARYLAAQIAELRQLLASGKGSDGTPLPPERRARLAGVLAEGDAGVAECGEFRFRGADVAFGDSLDIQLGGRLVRVLWLGRANTAGDALVHVPDAGVLATGDVVVHPFPFATQSYLSEWAQVLRQVERFDAPILVPGHGPVLRDRAYVQTLAELFESVMAQARAAYRPGMSAGDLRGHVDVSALRERVCGSDRVLLANFDAMVLGSGVERAWEELRGELAPEAMPRD
jgi:glyoxylase-like metal-dependent hydrolase (beta-lactamase superfamily II)